MEHKLATAERRVLVGLVKLVQKQKLSGENGEWKDFLKIHDKKHGANLSDPDRRSNDVLIAFLSTFKKKEDLQLIAKVLQCDVNRNLIEKFKDESPEKETPEQRLVRMTITHPDYAVDYAFPSFAEDWMVTEIGKKKTVMKSTEMLAIDCEMVTCDDGSEAVVRVAAVNRDSKVVLDKFVKPDKPVIDYKTDITGVTAEDVEKATLSVSDIQRKLRRFLSKGIILVGHSLNKDLSVLKIDHARVIDTSLVFKYSGLTHSKKLSLNNLCKLVLGYELRKENTAHDCVQDAAAAMKLVLAVVEKGVDTLIPQTNEMLEAEKTRLEDEKMKLLLHRIPHYVPSQELQTAINGDFTLEIKPAKKEGGFYAAVATFNSPEEANRAFENVDGKIVKDRVGLPQKLAEFKLNSGTGASLYVRKNVQDLTITKKSKPEPEKEEEENQSNEDDEMLEAEKIKLESDKAKLLIHKIPNYVSSQELLEAISGNFTLDVKPPKREGGFYTAVAIFSSSEEANRAFENVNGDLVKDRAGLPQKLAEFKLSSGKEASLYVRKMVEDSATPKRAHESEEEEEEKDNVRSKRQKREDENRCQDLLKQIEELKEKLKAKDFEIQAQDKMITNLKEKLEMKKKSKSKSK